MAAVASRYARALADAIAKAGLNADGAVAQIRDLAQAFQTSVELREVWDSPAIASAQKLSVLDALVARAGVTDRVIRNFIAVLIEKDRVALLPEIVDQLESELNARSGRVHAEIVSARALGPEQQSVLLAEISRLTGKAVLPRYSTDAALIGGVTVRVGSTIYDGSVRGQLQRMRRELTEG